MTEADIRDPRWEAEGRDSKADAIWRTVVQARGPQVARGRWLDVGCGSGGIAASLAPRVDSILGLDPEPWSRWKDFQAEHPNLAFEVADCCGEVVPVTDASIDVIVCNQVYEHVADPQALVAAIRRMLKPGGCCYFAGPNLLWPIEPHVNWPFVHWLPRRFAVALMRALGSARAKDLDAWSASYWRLVGWFRDNGLDYANAIPERLRANLAAQPGRLAWRLASAVPNRMLDLAAPLSPGHVFILYKR
jgi:2-polyprenyl-3-methyl-5-hydroxy-6-metoxy-1,4-benzoquinol methylase